MLCSGATTESTSLKRRCFNSAGRFSVKQIQFDKLGGPEVLKLVDAPKPEVAPGTVLIRNRAIGINFADTLFRQGQYATAPQLPDTPGLESAGTIEAVADGVKGLSVGMRVA